MLFSSSGGAYGGSGMAGKGDHWYQHAIFYEVSVRTFQDGNGDGLGDFIGLSQRLDDLVDLGVDCLWLLPMYPSPLRDDGYDIADFCSVHPDLGSLDDFRFFMGEARARGLRVIADLVLNHTSDQHPWFQQARQGRDNPYHDYYVWSDTDQQYRDARIIFLDTERSNWTWDEKAKQYFWHRFYHFQPDLNYENPRVQEAMFDVMRHWMELGLSGFRMDAIPYLYEAEGTNCENLPATHAYLKRLRRWMDAHYPDAIMLGEANQWPRDVVAYFGQGDELHATFNFPLMPRLFMAIAQEDRAPLDWIQDQIPPIPDGCQWAIFLRNHDELTLEMVTPEERQFMWDFYAPIPRMRLNLGIRRRLFPLLNDDPRQARVLHSILLTLPGSPVLYYGDEIGMGDNIWLPDRFGLRTPMQWNDDRNAGFSRAKPSHLYQPVITDLPYHYANVNVEAQREQAGSFLNWLKGMLRARKRFRAFGTGQLTRLQPTNPCIFPYLRHTEDETLLVVHNLSARSQAVELDLGAWGGYTPVEVPGGERFPPITSDSYRLTLQPYGYYWFQLSKP